MASKGQERENFFRINVLVVDHIKIALVNMFKYHLREYKNNMSFEKFIDEHMEDIEYLRKSRNLYQKEVDKLIINDKAISGLKVDDLEVTLVRRLLDNLCPELFMDGCKVLHDFLKKNEQAIYQLLPEDQYKKMFKSSPYTNCTGTSGTVCSSCTITDTEYIKFDYKIRCQILGHFSFCFKAMQKFTDLRNEAYGHIQAALIPKKDYDVYRKDIEDNIMVLAQICGNEVQTRLALNDVQDRSCDETLCIQYKIRLTEQIKRDQELMEVTCENSQKLQKLQESVQKIEKHLQKLTEQMGNMNLNKDDQAGAMTSCSQESSSNNISTGNDQSGQSYQSSIETDAEPYISSVNNDLENKRDIYDGVVLHAENDRDAAIEFITNMERENPDLKIDITISENLLLGTSELESPAKLFDSCRYLFVFVTQNFVKAKFEKFLSEIATIETLTFEEKNDRLIPVKTDKTYHSALAPFKSLKYNNYLEATKSQQGPDQYFIKCFRKLITNGRQTYLVS